MKAGRKSLYINANAIKTGIIITFINEKAEPVIDLRLNVLSITDTTGRWTVVKLASDVHLQHTTRNTSKILH